MALDKYQSDLKKLYSLAMAFDEALIPRNGSTLSFDESLRLYQELTVDALRYDRDASGSLFRYLADQARMILRDIDAYTQADLDPIMARLQAQLGHAIAHTATFSGNVAGAAWSRHKPFDPAAEETHQNVAKYLSSSLEILGEDLVESLIDNWVHNAEDRLVIDGPDTTLDSLLAVDRPVAESVVVFDGASLFISLLGLAVAFFTAGAGASAIEIVATWLIGTMVDAVMDIPTEGLWSIGRLAFDIIGGFAFG